MVLDLSFEGDNLLLAVATKEGLFSYRLTGKIGTKQRYALRSKESADFGIISALKFFKGKMLFAGTMNGTLFKFQGTKAHDEQPPKVHEGPINCLVSLGNNRLISGGEDNTIIIWDINTTQRITKVNLQVAALELLDENYEVVVSGIAPIPDSQELYIAMRSGSIVKHNMGELESKAPKTEIIVKGFSGTRVTDIAINDVAKNLYACCDGQTIYQIDFSTGKAKESISIPYVPVCLALMTNNDSLVALCSNGTMFSIKPATMMIDGEYRLGLTEPVLAIFCRTNELLAIGFKTGETEFRNSTMNYKLVCTVPNIYNSPI